MRSLSCESEDVNDDVVVLEGVLLAKIAVVLAVPEATGTHVESAVTLLENNHVGSELQVLVDFLEQLDDDLAGVIAPLLGLLRVVGPRLELFEN